MSYAEAALAGECEKIVNSAAGCRNSQLNTSAFRVGQLIQSYDIGRQEAEERLLRAAVSNGMSESEALPTIRSGLERGMENPRQESTRPAINKKAASDSYRPVCPVPEHASAPDLLFHNRKPSLVFEYRDAQGRLLCYRARYEALDTAGNPILDSNGKAKKTFIPWTYDGAGWRAKSLPNPLPLYGLQTLPKLGPEAQIIVVEGEAKADALRAICGPDTGVLSLNGGSASAIHTDLEPLQGRKVCYWPDNDLAGIEAALKIGERLRPMAQVLHIAQPLEAMGPGADVKDAIKAGWDWARIEGYLKAHAHDLPEFRLYAQKTWQIAEDADDWPEPVQFDDFESPEFRPDALPRVIADFALAASEETQTPFELAFMLALGAAAIACQGSYRIEIRPGYSENLNLFILVPMPPGERKSAIVKRCIEGLNTWEREALKELGPEIERMKSEELTIQKAIVGKRAKAARAQGQEELEEIKQAVRELEQSIPKIPPYPCLLADSITPEAAGSFLSQHNECMGILTSENGPMDILAGLYSSMPNLDVFLKGHCGDELRVDRRNMAPIRLRNPRISLVLAPQPICLTERKAAKIFRHRGLDARFLYCLPTSKVGNRLMEPELMPEDISRAFNHALLSLLPDPGAMEWPETQTLNLSNEAYEAWLEFSAGIETDLRPFGLLAEIRDWASKLAGAVARIAGIFHLLQRFDTSLVVRSDSMIKACYLGRCLIAHALKAYGLMDSSSRLAQGRYLLDWIKRQGKERFAFRACQQSTKGKFREVKDLEDALALLEERDFIRKCLPEKTGKGRPKKPEYLVHKSLLGAGNEIA